MMALPKTLVRGLDLYWASLTKLRETIAQIEGDLQSPLASFNVWYLYPYQALGGVSLAAASSDKYRKRMRTMTTMIREMAPAGVNNPAFILRARRNLEVDVSMLRCLIGEWSGDLSRAQALNEVTEVTSDQMITLRIVEPATEVYLISRGLAIMRQRAHFLRAFQRFDTILGPLERLMAKWAKPKLGEVALNELRKRHPPSSRLWWAYWSEAITEVIPVYLRPERARPPVK